MQIFEIVKTSERIADEFKYICDLYKDQSKRIDDSVLKHFKEVIDYYLAFYAMMYDFDPKQKELIYTNKKKLVQKLSTELESSKGKTAMFYHHMINLVTKTYDGAGAYFALVL